PMASPAGPGGRLHAGRLAHECLLVKREPGFPIHATDQVMQTRLMRQDHESHEVAVRREATRHSNEMLVGGQCRSRENYLASKIRSSVRKKGGCSPVQDFWTRHRIHRVLKRDRTGCLS